MKEIIRLLRPYQYLKNSFIFLPLFFAGRFTDTHLLCETSLVVLAFCLAASAIYILNDYFDRESDRQHPTKKNRPLASGKVKPETAGILFVILLGGAAAILALINTDALMYTGIYVGMNIGYSFGLKHVPILDITMISVGFVLRLFVGEAAGEGKVPLSMWIILITFVLALFLALAKRRDDVLLSADGNKIRKVVDGYNLEFINGGMIIMASVTVVCYIMYTIDPKIILKFKSEHLYYTVVFVILGILRYLQITFVENKSGNPTRVLLRDIFLQLVLAGWILSYILIIYR
jgi:decaprenyl-phosphate phosphoribosyltransferase